MDIKDCGHSAPYTIGCAICGKACIWLGGYPDDNRPHKFSGWYCKPCDSFTKTGAK